MLSKRPKRSLKMWTYTRDPFKQVAFQNPISVFYITVVLLSTYLDLLGSRSSIVVF